MTGYADRFIEGVKSYLPGNMKGNMVFTPFDWNSFTHPRQVQIYDAVEAGLLRQKLRFLKHTLGADLLWYGRTKDNRSTYDFYSQIHQKLEQIIQDFQNSNKTSKNRVFLIGHSQGSQILLDHCFESLTPIYGLFTMGSPISAKSGCFHDFGHLPPDLKFWVNFYNPLDFISSRLEKVHPSPQINSFVKDYKVVSYNPLNWTIWGAHSSYWKDTLTHQTVAQYLKNNIV